ncbi:TPA: helix-turn-helix transcriptional regulator [Escherichia coli]|nr:helix-turn-helix transcriptional regulator [Escherichia coli]
MINIIKNNSQREIKVTNVRINKYTIVYTNNCVVDFLSSDGRKKCGSNQFIFIDKGTYFTASLRKIDKHKKPYVAIRFDDDKLKILRRLIVDIYFNGHQKTNYTITSKDKILTITPTDELRLFFRKLSSTNDEKLFLIKVLFFISKFDERNCIVHSIITSSVSHFSDEVRALIDTNLKKKWCIQDMVEYFYLSESTIRKRLAKENTSIKKIILQARLNKSIELIIENKLQISQISSEVGVPSASYFIKNFKEYFGVTPKKLKNYFTPRKINLEEH